MPDRTINFGESETEATYQMQDTDAVDGGGDFVLAKDTNNNRVLLKYNPSSDGFEFVDSPTGTYGKTIAASTPTAYFSGPAHGEGGDAFRGATLAPDGRVIFAPNGSSNVGIFDPATDTYTSGPAHGEGGNAFFGATLAPDGRVIFAPHGSSNVGIVSQLLDIATANTANR